MSIYHRIQKAKENPDSCRAGSPWSPEEDEKLVNSVFEDKPLALIAFEHKRTAGGVEIRLRLLAYNAYKEPNGNLTVEEIAQKYKIYTEDFKIYVKDRERYFVEKTKKQEELFRKKDEVREQKKEEKEKKEKEREKIKKEKEELQKQDEERKEIEKQKIKEERELQIKEEEEKCYNYIYCLREREFLRSQEKIYKVGKTEKHPFKRLKQYPNGSELVLLLKVENCNISETKLLRSLEKKFKPALVDGMRIGNEYFEVSSEEEIVKEIFGCLVF